MRKIYIDNLPKYNYGKSQPNGVIDWKRSIGYVVRFIYDDIEGEIEIVGYDTKGQKLHIKYNNKSFKITTGVFVKCGLGIILNKRTKEFKAEIGQVFKDDKRDITIIDREYKKDKNEINRKYYKYTCNKCGYECGEHYNTKDKKYKQELWIEESNLLKGEGCSVCRPSPQIAVQGINDIPTTAPFMVKFFQGGYNEAKKYSRSCGKNIYPICPDCGRIKDKEMNIDSIYSYKSIACSCGDGVSYPEKFMNQVLKYSTVNFIYQLSKTTFQWCLNYKYDFYFKHNGEDYIVETHGSQHPNVKYYNNSYEKSGWKTYEQELQNDIDKKKLAIKNGVKEENYIVIDCSKSESDFIRSEITNSRLNQIFDLTSVNWNGCEIFALGNLCKISCDLKRDNPDMTTYKIGEIIGLSYQTVKVYLKKGNLLGWCEYDPKEEMSKAHRKVGKKNSKPVEIFKDGVSLGIFESGTELARQSKDLFGIKLHQTCISSACLYNETYNGFMIQYITNNF